MRNLRNTSISAFAIAVLNNARRSIVFAIAVLTLPVWAGYPREEVDSPDRLLTKIELLQNSVLQAKYRLLQHTAAGNVCAKASGRVTVQEMAESTAQLRSLEAKVAEVTRDFALLKQSCKKRRQAAHPTTKAICSSPITRLEKTLARLRLDLSLYKEWSVERDRRLLITYNIREQEVTNEQGPL